MLAWPGWQTRLPVSIGSLPPSAVILSSGIRRVWTRTSSPQPATRPPSTGPSPVPSRGDERSGVQRAGVAGACRQGDRGGPPSRPVRDRLGGQRDSRRARRAVQGQPPAWGRPSGAGQPSPLGAHLDRARDPPCSGSTVAMVSVWRVELGAANREARMEAGLSQAGLADELGVGQSSVSQWEHGTTAPATRHLLGLLQGLGALLVRLLPGEEASAAGARGAAGVASWPAGFVGGHVTPLDGDGPVLVGPPAMGAALPGRSLAALVGPWPGPGHLSEARGVPGSSARTGGGRCRGASGTGGLGA